MLPEPFVHAAVAVDLVVFTILDEALQVLLIRRGIPPQEGQRALPGGFVRKRESLEDAAYRELLEETGLRPDDLYLEQLYTFGAVDRDPRGRVITVAYYALVRPDLAIEPGTDAAWVEWARADEVAGLAFDHDQILATALARLRGKLDWTPIAFDLVPPRFTVTELRRVHEVIMGTPYDAPNFRRRISRWLEEGQIVETAEVRPTGRRPARVYTRA